MKRNAIFAVLFALLSTAARADNFWGRAILGYESYGNDVTTTAGFRQTYDLRLDKTLTTTSIFHLFFRGDDFRGTETNPALSRPNGSRQLQPGGSLMIDTSNVLLDVRSDVIATRSEIGDVTYERRQNRSSGILTWTPAGLPIVRVVGQRNVTTDHAAGISIDDDSLGADVQYTWRGLAALAQTQYAHAADPNVGYDRESTNQILGLAYTGANDLAHLTYSAAANTQLLHLDETAVGTGPTLIPTPVTIGAVLYTVDDTPLDNRDHPAAPYPGLNDGNLNASAGISVGPDAVSFQNLILDIGHIDRVDEVRIVVRDPSGNPLRNGGGQVTWDVYTSDDGQLWTAIPSETTYNIPLSLYSTTFTQTSGRWFKVVNFGLNSDPTLVTEVQAFYHTEVAPGQRRRGDQTAYGATAAVAARPTDKFAVAFSGLYSSIHENLATQAVNTTTDIEHLLNLQYDLTRAWSVRTELLKRDVQSFISNNDGATGITSYLDWAPTRQLRVSLELTKQDQTVGGTPFTLQTQAIHTSAFVLRSLQTTFDIGTQTQTLAADGSQARREFFNITANAQLTRRMRLFINGSMNRTTSNSDDPVTQLLGPQRDSRIDGEFVWRGGRELTLGVRIGWVAGPLLSGITQRYRVEWYPFADGTVALGGSYQEDIDPVLNRRATRIIFNPRWLINRYATFDLNYTNFRTESTGFNTQQRNLFATLTLTR